MMNDLGIMINKQPYEEEDIAAQSPVKKDSLEVTIASSNPNIK